MQPETVQQQQQRQQQPAMLRNKTIKPYLTWPIKMAGAFEAIKSAIYVPFFPLFYSFNSEKIK